MPHLKRCRGGDFVRSFLFGDSDIHKVGKCLSARLLMDRRTEGWVGIPHGGIGMGAIMELAMMLGNYPQDAKSLYPLSAHFRMGGPSAKIGDSLVIQVSEGHSGAEGTISSKPESLPYLSALIRYGDAGSHKKDLFASFIPGRISDIENKLLPLPYYKNCFVCGVDRSDPGLKRRFHFLDSHESSKNIVASMVGFDSQDSESIHLFRGNHFIHPLAWLALLDETMGWAGLMATGSGAVTVRISYTIYRGVRAGEKVVAFGRCDRVRGNAGSRLFFWASGGIAAVDEDGKLETVIAASGQWLGVSDLTRQMKVELMPKELNERAFRLAGAP